MASNSLSKNTDFLDNTEAYVDQIRQTSENPHADIQSVIRNLEGWQNLHRANLTPEEIERSDAMLAAYRSEANTLTTQYAQMRRKQQSATRRALDNSAPTPDAVWSETVGTPKEEVAEFRDDIKHHFENMPLNTFQDFQQALFFIEGASSLKLRDDLAKSLNLTPEEKEQLTSELPTVRAMLGSLLVQSLLSAGLKIQFRYGGVNITDAKRNSPSRLESINVNSALNAAIERDPTFLETLKAGIIYASDDFANFVQSKRSAEGNIRAIDMHEANFFDYMERVNRADKNPITQTILANRAEFKNMNFAQYATGTTHVPALLAAVKQIEANPQLQGAITQLASESSIPLSQTTQNTTTKGAVSPAPVVTSTATPAPRTPTYVTPPKTFAETWKELDFKTDPMGSTLALTGKWATSLISTIFEEGGAAIGKLSPMALLGAGIILIIGWKQFGFWPTLGVLGAGIMGNHLYQKHVLGEKVEQRRLNEIATPERRAELVTQIHGAENAEAANEILNKMTPFYPAKMEDLRQFFQDGKGNLPPDIRKLLEEDKELYEAVKKHFEWVNNRIEEIFTMEGFPEGAELKNTIRQDITLEVAEKIAAIKDGNEAKTVVLDMFDQAIAAETDPNTKAQLQELRRAAEQANTANKKILGGMFGMILLGATVGIGAIATTKLWLNVLAWLAVKVGAMVVATTLKSMAGKISVETAKKVIRDRRAARAENKNATNTENRNADSGNRARTETVEGNGARVETVEGNGARAAAKANHGDIPSLSAWTRVHATETSSNLWESIREIGWIRIVLHPDDVSAFDELKKNADLFKEGDVIIDTNGNPLVSNERQTLADILSRAKTEDGKQLGRNSDEILKRMLNDGKWNISKGLKSII